MLSLLSIYQNFYVGLTEVYVSYSTFFSTIGQIVRKLYTCCLPRWVSPFPQNFLPWTLGPSAYVEGHYMVELDEAFFCFHSQDVTEGVTRYILQNPLHENPCIHPCLKVSVLETGKLFLSRGWLFLPLMEI